MSRTDGVIDRVFGTDGGEPEDQRLYRDWGWVRGMAAEIVALEEAMRIAVRCLNAMPCPTSPGHPCGSLVESTMIAMAEHINLTDYDGEASVAAEVVAAQNESAVRAPTYMVSSSVNAGERILIGGQTYTRSEQDVEHHIAELKRKGAAINGRESWLLHELMNGGLPFVATSMPDDYARHLIALDPDHRVELVTWQPGLS